MPQRIIGTVLNEALVFTEYIAMMGTWIFAGYYVQKGVGRLAAGIRQKKESLRT